MITITEMAEVHAARIAERDAQIASLTGENERMRDGLIAIGECAKVLEQFPNDAAVRINLLSICRLHYELAALQPKGGD